jgi:hypothetical protein
MGKAPCLPSLNAAPRPVKTCGLLNDGRSAAGPIPLPASTLKAYPDYSGGCYDPFVHAVGAADPPVRPGAR